MSEAVRRAVRQRCGFGCVICGNGLIEYDHFDPEFADALKHDPEQIVLLCLYHHRLKSKAEVWLPAPEVRKAAAAPKALKDGFSTWAAPAAYVHPTIVFGELTCVNVDSLIEVDGESILSIAEPEFAGAPYRLSAQLSNATGTEVLEIVDNQVKTSSASWDIRLEGGRLRIWEASRKVSLILRFEENKIIIERLDMWFRGLSIQILEGKPTRFERGVQAFGLYRATLTGSQIAVRFTKHDMTIGVRGSVAIEELLLGTGRPTERAETATRLGGSFDNRISFAEGIDAMASRAIGWAGSVARLYCRLPANDDTFAPLA
jgi:hypothetical protein